MELARFWIYKHFWSAHTNAIKMWPRRRGSEISRSSRTRVGLFSYWIPFRYFGKKDQQLVLKYIIHIQFISAATHFRSILRFNYPPLSRSRFPFTGSFITSPFKTLYPRYLTTVIMVEVSLLIRDIYIKIQCAVRCAVRFNICSVPTWFFRMQGVLM